MGNQKISKGDYIVYESPVFLGDGKKHVEIGKVTGFTPAGRIKCTSIPGIGSVIFEGMDAEFIGECEPCITKKLDCTYCTYCKTCPRSKEGQNVCQTFFDHIEDQQSVHQNVE